jgi:tripartite ATP-independent transporter DctP family solute receptor
MKKLLTFFLVLLIIQGAFAGGAAESKAPDAAPQSFKLKWSGMMTDTHAWTIAEKAICEEVTRRTNGRITMEAYPAGSLGSQQEGIEMLRTGDLAFLTSGPSIFASYAPQAQIFTFPYMFKDREHVRRVIQAPVIQKMFNEEILNKTGVRTVAWWYYGARNLTTKNTPAKRPEDIANLKIRCVDNPAAKDVVLALGGNPTPVAFTELYFALQTGVVDGQENPVTTIYDKKFNEVQKYMINTEHNVHMGTVHVSEKIWQQLSEADRKMFMELFDVYTKKVDELIDQLTGENLKEMTAKGLQVVEPDREAFRRHAVAHITKVYGSDPKWTEVLNEVQAIK